MTPSPPQKTTQAQLDDILRRHRFFSIGKPGGARAVLKFQDLSSLDFRGIDLSGADFTGSDLSHANLSRCLFNGAALYGCNLSYANLEYAKFPRADLRGANLENARLEGTDLSTADLREGQVIAAKKDQSFTFASQVQKTIDYSEKREQREAQTDLSQTEDALTRSSEVDLTLTETDNAYTSDLDLSKENESSRISDLSLAQEIDPLIIKLQNHAKWLSTGGQQGVQLDITNEDVRNIADITQYPLTAILASGANFSGMNLAGAHLQSALLTGADFTDSNLSLADLRGANFRQAKLVRARLTGANLEPLMFGNRQKDVEFDGADLTDAIRD